MWWISILFLSGFLIGCIFYFFSDSFLFIGIRKKHPNDSEFDASMRDVLKARRLRQLGFILMIMSVIGAFIFDVVLVVFMFAVAIVLSGFKALMV